MEEEVNKNNLSESKELSNKLKKKAEKFDKKLNKAIKSVGKKFNDDIVMMSSSKECFPIMIKADLKKEKVAVQLENMSLLLSLKEFAIIGKIFINASIIISKSYPESDINSFISREKADETNIHILKLENGVVPKKYETDLKTLKKFLNNDEENFDLIINLEKDIRIPIHKILWACSEILGDIVELEPKTRYPEEIQDKLLEFYSKIKKIESEYRIKNKEENLKLLLSLKGFTKDCTDLADIAFNLIDEKSYEKKNEKANKVNSHLTKMVKISDKEYLEFYNLDPETFLEITSKTEEHNTIKEDKLKTSVDDIMSIQSGQKETKISYENPTKKYVEDEFTVSSDFESGVIEDMMEEEDHDIHEAIENQQSAFTEPEEDLSGCTPMPPLPEDEEDTNDGFQARMEALEATLSGVFELEQDEVPSFKKIEDIKIKYGEIAAKEYVASLSQEQREELVREQMALRAAAESAKKTPPEELTSEE